MSGIKKSERAANNFRLDNMIEPNRLNTINKQIYEKKP